MTHLLCNYCEGVICKSLTEKRIVTADKQVDWAGAYGHCDRYLFSHATTAGDALPVLCEELNLGRKLRILKVDVDEGAGC